MKQKFTSAWGILIFISMLLFIGYFVTTLIIDLMQYAATVNTIMNIVRETAQQIQPDVDMAEVERIAVPIVNGLSIGLIALTNVFVLIPMILVIVRFFSDKARHATMGFVIVYLILNLIGIGGKLYAYQFAGGELAPVLLSLVGFVAALCYIVGHSLDKRKAVLVEGDKVEEVAPEAPKAPVVEEVKPEAPAAAPEAPVAPEAPAAPKAKKKL